MITPITSQTCHAKPKTQINRRRTLPASFPLVDAYRKQFGLKDFSPKSQDVTLQQIKERGALPMIDRRGLVRQSTVAVHSASLLGAGYGQSEHKADSLIAKFKEVGNGQERLMYEQSHRDYLRPGYLHHRLACHGLLTSYRDNAITYKAQRDKNARELKLANAAITAMQMRQRDVAALDAKYTKELAGC